MIEPETPLVPQHRVDPRNWRDFVDALYRANEYVPLPPPAMVTGITVEVDPSNLGPIVTFQVVGLSLPNAVNRE